MSCRSYSSCRACRIRSKGFGIGYTSRLSSCFSRFRADLPHPVCLAGIIMLGRLFCREQVKDLQPLQRGFLELREDISRTTPPRNTTEPVQSHVMWQILGRGPSIVVQVQGLTTFRLCKPGDISLLEGLVRRRFLRSVAKSIRIGFCGPVYHHYHKEPPQNSIGNYL